MKERAKKKIISASKPYTHSIAKNKTTNKLNQTVTNTEKTTKFPRHRYTHSRTVRELLNRFVILKVCTTRRQEETTDKVVVRVA